MKQKTAFPPGPSLARYGFIYLSERCDYLRLAKRMFRTYGDIAHVQSGSRHHYFINHPDYIEKVLTAGYKMRTSRPRPLRHALGRGLITSQGALHRKMRGIIQSFFQTSAVRRQVGVMLSETERAVARWRDGETRDMLTEMTHLTLGVILRILFGVNFEDEIDAMGRAGYEIHRRMHQDPASHLNMRLERIPFFGAFTRPARARRFIDEKIYGMIRDRRRCGTRDRPDVLSALLRAQKEADDPSEFRDKQVRDEMLTMFIAGHETTANALSWTWYLLSRHPEAERKLHDEVDRVLGGRRPVYKDIHELRYTRMVLSESMRLYPPVWTMGRRPEVDDFQIGGYTIPQKSTILISPYLAHHDERFFPDPERFDPERFTPEVEAKRPKFSYLPFGGGTRSCVGAGMAWTEGMLMLSAIAAHWRFRLVEGHRVELEPLIALKPKYGLRMIMEKRRVFMDQKKTQRPSYAEPVSK